MRAWLRRRLPAALYDRLAASWDRLRRLHPARVLRRRAYARANRGAGPDEIVLRPGLRLAIAPGARESFEPFCFGSLEMARELDAFLAARPRHLRLLDVGALHGLFALAFTAGRPEARALAVDPSPLAQEVLCANLRRNPELAVEAVTVALGEHAGTLAMRQDWQHLEAVAPGTETGGPVIEVPLATLDDLCRERGFVPDLLKIDVEGYELAVLAGARETLAHARPEIFLEIHPARLAELGSSAAEVVARLRDAGYTLRPVDGGSLDRKLRAGRVFRAVALPT